LVCGGLNLFSANIDQSGRLMVHACTSYLWTTSPSPQKQLNPSSMLTHMELCTCTPTPFLYLSTLSRPALV
jgi:hypothetical protein